MKSLFTTTNLDYRQRSSYQQLPFAIFFLIAVLSFVQVDVKTVLSEETKLANVEHDIDDIINTTKTKYKPTTYRRNSSTEAELPRDVRRRQESRQNNSQPNRPTNRKRN